MKIREIVEGTPTKSYCKTTPVSQMGASAKASCKSRGLIARKGKKSHKLSPSKDSRVTVGGKRIKGERYGGPLPHYGSGS